MSAIPCPTKQDCLDGCPGFNPIQNLSAEAPDNADFLATVFYNRQPPLNSPNDWYNPGPNSRVGTCQSPVSQQAAHDCALQDAINGDPQPHPPPRFFFNTAQQCSIPCGSAPDFVYTVPAGTFTGRTQAEANVLAASYCQSRAYEHRQCPPVAITGMATEVMADSARLNGTVNPNGEDTVFQFEWGTTTLYGNVTAPSSVPAGNIANASALLSGLTDGTEYHFRIVASNSMGLSVGEDATFKHEEDSGIIVLDFYPGSDGVLDLSPGGVVCGSRQIGGSFFPAYYFNGENFLNQQIATLSSGETYACNDDLEFGGYQVLSAGGVVHGFYEDLSGLRDLGVVNEGFAINDNGIVLMQGTDDVVRLFDPLTSSVTPIGAGTLYNFLFTFRSRCFNDSAKFTYTDQAINNKIFLWNGVSGTDITPIGAGFGSPVAVRVTNATHIAGSIIQAGQQKGWISVGGAASLIAPIIPLGDVDPQDMNESDVMVGEAENGIDFVAFKWDSVHGISQIPALPATTYGIAYGINAAGVIIGQMGTEAFFYKDGVTKRLFDVLAPEKMVGWDSLDDARFINDNRQIVGFGTYNGDFKWFILKYPTDA
jgi:hypothetical protein